MDNKFLQIKDTENQQQYLWRIGSLKDAGIITLTWGELAPVMNEQLGIDKNADTYRHEYNLAKRYKENVFDVASSSEMNAQKIQVEALKKQAQTKNIETNRLIREYARDGLITEEVINSVRSLQPLSTPTPIIEDGDRDKVGILCFGDEHFGCEFELKGLNGEIINKYDTDTFYHRMDLLCNKTIDIGRKNGLKDLYVFSLGDFCDGLIHLSQLSTLQYGVIDSLVKYSEYICVWLNTLSQCFRVHYQQTAGNHTELRLLNMKKNDLHENLDDVLRAFIKIRMENNPNFDFVENPTGYIYQRIFDRYNIIGIHGEKTGNPVDIIKSFTNAYGVTINYMIAGHYHHGHTEEVGRDVEFIGIPSVMGTNDYSMGINATANSGATFLIFENGLGKTVQYTINLS